MDFKPENLIIDRADLVPSGQKFTAWGITLLFWGALLYLWQPLLSLLAWGFNIRLFYHHMILLGGYRTFVSLLLIYTGVIALLGGSLILWGLINQWRFRGKERRTGRGNTDRLQLCASFGVDAEQLSRAVASAIVSVDVNVDGSIRRLEAASAHPSSPALGESKTERGAETKGELVKKSEGEQMHEGEQIQIVGDVVGG